MSKKEVKIKNVMIQIFQFTRRYKKSHMIGIMISIICTITLTIGPYITKFMIDDVLNSKSKDAIIIGMVIFAGISILNPVFEFLKEMLYMKLNQVIICDLCNSMFTKTVNAKIDFFNHNKKGQIVSRIVNDSSLASNIIKNFYANIINNILLVIMFFIGMFIISYKICMLIAVLYLIFIIINVKYSGKFESLSEKTRKNTDAIFNNVSQMIDTIESIKAFSLENQTVEKYSKALNIYKKSNIQISKLRILLFTLGNFYELLAISFVYGIGGIEMINGNLTVGDVMALGVYFQMLKWPIQELISSNMDLNSAIPVFNRINEYLDMDQEYKSGISELCLEDDLKLNNVSFKYGHGEKLVLEKADMIIPKTGLIAILGESGQGKSTLVKLLLKFYEPTEGEIFLGKNKLSEMGVDTVRNNVGYVAQDMVLFNDTIENNIKCGRDISHEKIVDYCKKFNLYEKIIGLENGFETLLNERSNLSGGEKQRLGIIRAISRNNRVLILDEPTASLDSDNENIVDNELEKLSKDMLIVVISHRKNILDKADKIFKIEDSKYFQEVNYRELEVAISGESN